MSIFLAIHAVGTATGAVGITDLSDEAGTPPSGEVFAAPGVLTLPPGGLGFLQQNAAPLAFTGEAPQDIEQDDPADDGEYPGESEATDEAPAAEDTSADEPLVGEGPPTDELPAEETAAEYTAPIEYVGPPVEVWEPLPWDIERGPNWTDRVLLTYDDCMSDPDRFIAVLDHATDIGVGLLIFPTGNCVLMFRNLWDLDLLQIIRERGHWVGHHTMSHPDLTRLGHNQLIAEITGNVDSNLLRPPFGSFNNRVVEAAISVGKSIVYWSLDTNDWRRGSTEESVVAFIIEYAQPGDNVLMHLQHAAFSENALTQIQAGLAARGLRVCAPAPVYLRPTPSQVPPNIC